MKLDYESIKSLLEEAEARCDGFNTISIKLDFSNKDEKAKAYHYKILFDEKFLDGSFTKEDDYESKEDSVLLVIYNNGTMGLDIQLNGLTLNGHRLLESMRNDTLWNKVKKTAASLGIESLKQIPGLSIKLLTELT